ncbi:hypothetical protein GCM10010965_11770 [Caldalkalibacillus thermarum]|nr:hypothetical protein GCM10010965_11770 [Caldalkalibacillus thermarum]
MTASMMWNWEYAITVFPIVFQAEIYRSGIESIPKGQWEACTALNFSRLHTWTKVILPQAVLPVLPMCWEISWMLIPASFPEGSSNAWPLPGQW